MRIGTAGWTISREAAPSFAGEGAHLVRYSKTFNCGEVNSSFRRSHRTETYERWASLTPANFRFSVKLPRSVTHEGQLGRVREPLLRFLDEVAGLGGRLGVLLVQLPPSLAFEARTARRFLSLLRRLFDGAVVCEARHASWFTPACDKTLASYRVGRVAADPAHSPIGHHPGGWMGPEGDGRGAVVYHRWHGTPRVYWSRYEGTWLQARATELTRWPVGTEKWCIFDNTAAGAAVFNALELRALLSQTGAAEQGGTPPTEREGGKLRLA